MSPRFRLCNRCLRNVKLQPPSSPRYLATAAAITPAAPPSQTTNIPPPIAHFPPTQPPSHKPPEFRKSQLHRQYTSLLRSTPLFLLFQHLNLTSREWMAIRRELSVALNRTDDHHHTAHASDIKLLIIQAGIFESALRIAEYYNPPPPPQSSTTADTKIPPGSASQPQYSTATPSAAAPSPTDPTLTHALSRHAHTTVSKLKNRHPLTPLLSGPLAILTFPTVSPHHLSTALSILSPDKAGGFPAPTRRASPEYHDPAVQGGVQKLVLMGARIEGKVMDQGGVKWVGGLEGLEGLRAQVVALLGGAGGGNLVGALEGVGRGLWVTMEGRRGMLEEEAKEKGKGQ